MEVSLTILAEQAFDVIYVGWINKRFFLEG